MSIITTCTWWYEEAARITVRTCRAYVYLVIVCNTVFFSATSSATGGNDLEVILLAQLEEA